MPDSHPIVYLSITSFRGLLGWAEHYYGRLRCGEQEADLQHVLTAAEARRANDKQDYGGWKKDDFTIAFSTEEAVIAEARRNWRGTLPDTALLVIASHCEIGPFEVLDGPPELVKKLNDINTRAQKVWWRRDRSTDSQMNALCKEWETLWPGGDE